MIQYRSYKTHITDPALIERVGFLLALVKDHANQIIEKYWTNDSLSEIIDSKLPSQHFMKYRRLNWTIDAGAYLPDRVKRMAESQAMIVLCEQARLNEIVIALTTDAKIPLYTTSHDIKRLKKSIEKHNGGIVTSIIDIYQKPVIRNIKADTGTVDSRLYLLNSVIGRNVSVSIKLPLVAFPEKRKDWEWEFFEQLLPKSVDKRFAKVCPPVITNKNLVFPLEYELPEQSPATAVIGMGFDWGITTLATLSVGSWHNGEVSVAHDHYTIHPERLLNKIEQLRQSSETLQTKINSLNRLIKGGSQFLVPKMHSLVRERSFINKKRSSLNNTLAWTIAKRITGAAVKYKATVIYVENLATLEAGGFGKELNTAISQANRSQIVQALRHTAAKHNISVVLINPSKTSQSCHCGATVTHPVWKTSHCSACNATFDRDALAADMILSRGFATRSTTKRNKTGSWVTKKEAFARVTQRAVSRPRRVVTLNSRILVSIVAISSRRSDLTSKETNLVSYRESRNNHLIPLTDTPSVIQGHGY